MSKTPMMKCGHAANATSNGKPSCVICHGISDGKNLIIDDTPPDLAGRTARCSFYGSTPSGWNHGGPCERGARCLCEVPSSPALAFFESRPCADHDRYYCGCWGWD